MNRLVAALAAAALLAACQGPFPASNTTTIPVSAPSKFLLEQSVGGAWVALASLATPIDLGTWTIPNQIGLTAPPLVATFRLTNQSDAPWTAAQAIGFGSVSPSTHFDSPQPPPLQLGAGESATFQVSFEASFVGAGMYHAQAVLGVLGEGTPLNLRATIVLTPTDHH